MLYVCVQKFNVTGNLQIFWELTKALHLICPRSNIPRLFWTHFKHMTEFRRISQESYIVEIGGGERIPGPEIRESEGEP